MTTKIDLTKIAKAVALGTAIAIGASYAASCTPKYKPIFEKTQKAPETYQIPLDYNGNNLR